MRMNCTLHTAHVYDDIQYMSLHHYMIVCTWYPVVFIILIHLLECTVQYLIPRIISVG